jgi:hypothetical protein
MRKVILMMKIIKTRMSLTKRRRKRKKGSSWQRVIDSVIKR